MKIQKKNTYIPRKYWKDKIGFDNNEEFLIYQYLCGNIKKRDIKKVNEKKRYQTYKSWKAHVEELLNNCEDDVLLEFYHFVKLEERRCSIDMGLNNQFAIPLAVAIVANVLIQCLVSSDFLKLQAQPDTALETVSVFILSVFSIFTFGGTLGWLLLHYMSQYVGSKKMTVFWEDYLDIIEMKMKARNMKE